MRYARFRPGLFAAVMALGGIFLFWALPDADSETPDYQPGQPKLVVMIVFDQMRGDYLTKWEALFDKEGFGRVQRDGAWYQNCHYPYGWTLTGAGHASLSTGCSPYKHGIIGNGWYDREARANVNAVSANKYRIVPDPMDPKEKLNGPSPERLKQPTVGEGLHKMSQGKAKIVSLSIKDRSAILLAGLRATAVYWYNTARNLFQTSTYYRDTVHPWVADFNKERPADKYFGKAWDRLRPDVDYVKYSGPDDVKVEGTGVSQGRTFPHAMAGGKAKPEKNFYEAVTHSPYGNELLLDLAKRAIDAEKLGQRDVCDMLCLSFSCNDLVGHTWGPDSQEVM
ncbi:MAG TPA: alkaline phosphatase family protein, partial [Gemmataceae bacterium]|nr:alkaline phosphatase family protein [Gemmataceae bacterium]